MTSVTSSSPSKSLPQSQQSMQIITEKGGRMPSSTSSSSSSSLEKRHKARQEATECVRMLEREGFQLDGFNLLGVVANPRAGMIGSGMSSHAHAHPPNVAASAQSAAGGGTSSSSSSPEEEGSISGGGAATDMFSEAVSSLGFTLGQVTEGIETMNLFLEELSREYLGDDTGGETHFLEHFYEEEENNSQLGMNGGAMATANMGTNGEETSDPSSHSNQRYKQQLEGLSSYIQQSGTLAHSLFAQGLETTSSVPVSAATTDTSSKSLSSPSADILLSSSPDIEDLNVPGIFYDPVFNLKQSETFIDLLLNDKESEQSNQITSSNGDGTINASTDTSHNALYQPTSALLPVREQDELAGHLDRVELALQEQVRLKADAFFQETTRFRQLQSSISQLLDQVQIMRQDVHSVLSMYRQTKDISNHQRQEYELFVQLVDAATNLVQTKASIGGLLSANDQLGAVNQVQYGRRLLHEEFIEVAIENTRHEDSNNGTLTNDAAIDASQKPLILQNLVALSSINDQFQQYEQLVVQSLSDEVIDLFFNWRSSEGPRVKAVVEALNLCQAWSKTGEIYNRRLQQTIRMTVRTTIAEFVESSGSSGSGVTGMSYADFFSCLQLLMEELHILLQGAKQVDDFAQSDGLFVNSDQRWTQSSLTAGADLASKSIAELLRLRKEAHSLLTLDEMRRLWDTCLEFANRVEEDYSANVKAAGLRSTLVGQVKAFLDRTHEANMASLVAALESERWTPCEVSSERQAALTRLCTGRSISAIGARWNDGLTVEGASQKKPTAEVEGVHYKVVWSSLLLVEMIMTNLAAAGHFQSLATNAMTKVSQLLRLFNTRSTNLVLGAGAIHSTARLKSINAKHLSMVTQCVGMMTALLPHIRAALAAQLPSKQHTLLSDLDKIKKEYTDHSEKVLNKFVSIIGGIVEKGLTPKIPGTDFDARAKDTQTSESKEVLCCVFLEGIASNTRKMHQVLNVMLPPEHLQDVFSRIFAYLDNTVPNLFISAASNSKANNRKPSFRLPGTNEGKHQLLSEIESMTIKLNELAGVLPWDFTCTNVMERRLDYNLSKSSSIAVSGEGDCSSLSATIEEKKSSDTDTSTNDENNVASISQQEEDKNCIDASGGNEGSREAELQSDIDVKANDS